MTTLIDNRVDWVIRTIHDNGPLTVGALRKRAASKHRAAIQEAVDQAVSAGLLSMTAGVVGPPSRSTAGGGTVQVEPPTQKVEPTKACKCSSTRWDYTCRNRAHARRHYPGDYPGNA